MKQQEQQTVKEMEEVKGKKDLELEEMTIQADKMKKQNFWMTALQLKIKKMIQEKLEKETKLREQCQDELQNNLLELEKAQQDIATKEKL